MFSIRSLSLAAVAKKIRYSQDFMWEKISAKRPITFFYPLFFIVMLASLVTLLAVGKWEGLPAILFSGFAVFFSFQAYFYTQEKFRLELFEKRWEIYESTLRFCSIVTAYGSLKMSSENEEDILQAFRDAEASFRGIGYHKTKCLFGEDIYSVFNELNSIYSWLVSYTDNPRGDGSENRIDQIKTIWRIVNELPNTFATYLYFGNYRNNS